MRFREATRRRRREKISLPGSARCSSTNEFRIVHIWEDASPDDTVTGYALEWHPEQWVQSIRVHPQADEAFAETVTKVVEQYATPLKDRIQWSSMTESPPF